MGATPGLNRAGRLLAIAITALVGGAIIAQSQLYAHLRLGAMDDHYFGYVGWRLTAGDQLYTDVWDNKPPGVFWLNALGFLLTPNHYAGVIALNAAALALGTLLFAGAARRGYGLGVALLTTVLFVAYWTHAAFHGGSNRPETYLTVCELAAALAYLGTAGRARWLIAAGVAAALAATFKQTGLAVLLAVVLHGAACGLLRRDWRRTAAALVWPLAGFALVGVLVMAVLLLTSDAGDAWHAIVAFNRAYFATGDSVIGLDLTALNQLSLRTVPVLTLPLFLLVTGIVFLMVWGGWPRPGRVSYPPPVADAAAVHTFGFALVWLAASVQGALVSPHGHAYYYLPMIAPLWLAAGYVLAQLRREGSLLRGMQQRIWITGAVVALALFAYPAVARHTERVLQTLTARNFRTAHDRPLGFAVDPYPWEITAQEIRRLTTPTDRVFCWGYWPSVYFHAQRPPATRFFTTEKLVHLNAGAADQPSPALVRERARLQRTIRAGLTERPPAVIAIEPRHWRALDAGHSTAAPNAAFHAWFVHHVRRLYLPVADRHPDAGHLLFIRQDLASTPEPLP